jgi:hypothetical protein
MAAPSAWRRREAVKAARAKRALTADRAMLQPSKTTAMLWGIYQLFDLPT